MRPLVLASTSRYRRELLARLCVAFEARAPLIDEEAEKARLGPVSPGTLVRTLGRLKAESLGPSCPGALVIGSDQLVELDGEVLGKPHTQENAVRQLLRLSGRGHRLLTSVAIHESATGRTEEALDVHELELRTLSEAEVRAYVARDLPLDCAGSYKVEGLGIALFRRLRGEDFTGIVGLPLTRVVELLERFGERVLA